MASIGAIQAMCSFHSIPNSCQSGRTFGGGSRGEHSRIGAQVSALARVTNDFSRYHGYTIQVPVITVAQAATAIALVPTFRRRMRSAMPAVVTYSGRRL